MSGVAFTVNDAGFRSRMSRLVATAKRPAGLMAAVGREGANALKRHFRARNASGANKMGGTRTKFWLQIMRSVQSPKVNEAAGEVVMSITDGRINQKVFGGEISAKKAGALTIPLIKEAYGRRASVFEHEEGVKLFQWPPKTGDYDRTKLFLAFEKDGRLQLAYLLTKSVWQDKDPQALPDEKKMAEALIHRAEEVVTHQLEKI